MNQSIDQQENSTPDLTKIFDVLKKRKRIFLSVVALFLIMGFIYISTATPVYQSDSVILIGTQTSDHFAGKNKQFEEVDPTNTEFYKTQYALLQSRSVVKSVIEDLNLLESEEFKPRPPMIDLSFIKKRLKFLKKGMESLMESLGITKKDSEKAKIKVDPSLPLIQEFMQKLKVSPVTKSHVVQIGFQGYDPALITQINNAYLDALIKKNIKRRGKVLDGSEKWMTEKLQDLK